MGQGITTSTTVITADEIDLPMDKVVVTLADSRPELLFNQLTGGSSTTYRPITRHHRLMHPAAGPVTYPPEPWELCGQLYGSAFLVPLDAVPVDVPAGCRPVRVGRFGVVGAVWVSYEPGGVLSYRELMATLLVRRGLRPVPTITHIWVDSAASRDGGRALWGIPKDLAGFEFGDGRFLARRDGSVIARGTARTRLRVPGRWPVRFAIAQTLRGRTTVSPVRSRASFALAQASFEAERSGPLGWLAGRRPLVSFVLSDFEMSFGGGRS